MALATRCPNCHALFRVVADQLKLRGGLVRCGACGHVFDAIGTLSYLDDASMRPVSAAPGSATPESASPVTLRFTADGSRAESFEAGAGASIAPVAPISSGALGTDVHPRIETDSPARLDTAAHSDEPSITPENEPIPVVTHEPLAAEARSRDGRSESAGRDDEASPWSPAIDAAVSDMPVVERLQADEAEVSNAAIESAAFLAEQREPRRKTTVLAVAAGEALLFIALLSQFALIFRTDIAAHWPATRPALARACQALNCTVGWPTRGEMLAVVGSELQSLPGTSALELTAVVRNRDAITLALPAIEVTLTDTQNRALARKVFAPGEYLSAGEAAARLGEGIEAGADMTIRITFEARGLAPAGFVVYPFYL